MSHLSSQPPEITAENLSTSATSPNGAWSVSFFNGSVHVFFKTSSLFVRAVRGGS